eukprot:scaffold32027_cov75-Attheya_sp.AAC.1
MNPTLHLRVVPYHPQGAGSGERPDHCWRGGRGDHQSNEEREILPKSNPNYLSPELSAAEYAGTCTYSSDGNKRWECHGQNTH